MTDIASIASEENGRIHPTEVADIDTLTDHPENYQEHPEDQLDHICSSLERFGFYKNVVTSADYVLLAGHGVVKGARRLGWTQIPIIKLPIKHIDPDAYTILAGDNEQGHMAEKDDRALSLILKHIKEFNPVGLLGTGFNDQSLANLVFVTRPQTEIQDFNQAEHWAGMPEYEPASDPFKLIVSFETEEDRKEFMDMTGVKRVSQVLGKTVSIWWPEKEVRDSSSVRIYGEGDDYEIDHDLLGEPESEEEDGGDQ